MPQEPNITIIHGGTLQAQYHKALELARTYVQNLHADFRPDDMSNNAAGVFRKMIELHRVLAVVNFHIPPNHEPLKALIVATAKTGIPVILAVADDFIAPIEFYGLVKYERLTPGNHTRL